MGQVVEAGWKVRVANKPARGGAGEVGDGDCGTSSVRSVDEGEDKGMTQACRKECASRGPITRIFVEKSGSGEAPKAFGSGTGKAVSVEPSIGLSSSVPFVRVMAGRICHAYPGAEGVRDEAARAERGLHKILEFISKVHRL